jgi:vitamin B12 transporter
MRAVLIVAGLVGVTGTAIAQTPTDPAGTPAPVSAQAPAPASEPAPAPGPAPAPAKTYADSVVVTATLAPEERDQVPGSVTVIDAREIRDRQATEVAELLRTAPGLAVVRSGSPGKVTSLFSRGANSNQTLVLWNGVQLNDPFGGGFDLAFLPTEGVERVEVVRGPYSALYGADAVGGVVQVITGRRRGVGLRLEGGDDGYRRAGVAAGFDAGPAGALHLDLTGHLRRGDGEVENDGYDADEAAARLSWRPAPSATLGLAVRGNDAEVGVPFDFFGKPSPHRLQDRELRLVAVPFDWQGERWGLVASASRLETELAFLDPDDPFSEGKTDAATSAGRAVANLRTSDRLWVAFGADWERQEATSVDAFSTVDDVTQRTWAGFGEVHWRAGRVALDAGLRRDDNDAYGTETTAKLGAVAELGGGARLRASWGEGFRAPTLVDLYFPGFGNPELEPETSDSFEVGLEADRGRWQLALVGFELDQRELIVFDFTSGVPLNVGRARSRGVEAEARLAAGPFHGRLAASWLDAENLDTGTALPRRPEKSASLVLGWTAARWTASVVGRYAGERTDVGGVALDAYAVADLGVSWRAGRFEPYARVENLFDERYEEAAGFPAPDRALVGGLALDF